MSDRPEPSFTDLRRLTAPETAEIEANARSRSSRLRSAIRTDAAAWGQDVPLPTDLPDLEEVL